MNLKWRTTQKYERKGRLDVIGGSRPDEMRSCYAARHVGLVGARAALVLAFLVIISFLTVSVSYGGIPSITDDAGTVGKNGFQVEVLGEYTRDKEEGIKSKALDVTASFTYGIHDAVDIVLSFPYQSWKVTDQEGFAEKERGISDLALEVKWRFFDRDGFSLAAKPGLTLPTGNEKKGLGAGRATYSMLLIASKEVKPWSLDANIGYTRNENRHDERKDLWSIAIGASVEVSKYFKLVANAGIESNPDKGSKTAPAWMLGGFIYSPHENFNIGLGVSAGLTKPSPDLSLRGGITWSF